MIIFIPKIPISRLNSIIFVIIGIADGFQIGNVKKMESLDKFHLPEKHKIALNQSNKYSANEKLTHGKLSIFSTNS